MNRNNTTIVVDAMGGDGSPKKVIDGINISLKPSNTFKSRKSAKKS